jgi:hypothetical protein
MRLYFGSIILLIGGAKIKDCEADFADFESQIFMD